MTTSEFIAQFRTSNPRDLAFKASRYPDVDMPFALNQIQGWQTARLKLPTWAEAEGVVYPPHLNMEQCSSEPAARYKQDVVGQWLERIAHAADSQSYTGATRMADLTGGFGVDFSFTSRCFDRATYVERNAALCDVVRGNLPRLGISNARVVCCEAEHFLNDMEPQTMLFLDPARRDQNGAKTVFLADCTPDVGALLPQLMEKSRFTMLKLSPMLDWHKAVSDLQGMVREVHIVSVAGECKELLLVLSRFFEGEGRVVCVDISAKADAEGHYVRQVFEYKGVSSSRSTLCPTDAHHLPEATQSAALSTAAVSSGSPAPPFATVSSGSPAPPFATVSSGSSAPPFIYEPNASVMKAGCFDELSRAFGMAAVSRNSHLFVSADRVEGFPGRGFAVDAVTTMNKRELRQTLGGLKQANIAVRNFPLSVAELRKRLKLKDGGDTYIFATTTTEGEHLLVVCHKA